MNNVTLVGRLTGEPEIKELNDGTFRTLITVAVSRDYRNLEGEREADFVKCVLWNGIASATKDYCHKGDIVGIKGKLQSRTYENNDNEKKHILEVLVEKITFISSNQPKNAWNFTQHPW